MGHSMATSEFQTISKYRKCFGDIVVSILGESVFTELKEEIQRLDSDIPEDHLVDFITGKAVYEQQSDVCGFNHAEEWQKQQFLFVCVCGHQRKPKQREIDKRLRREEIMKFAEKYNINVEDHHVAYAFDATTFVKELQRLLNEHKEKEYLRFVLLGHGTRVKVETVVQYALRTHEDAIPNPNVHGVVGNIISHVDPASLGKIDFHFLYCYAKRGAPEKDLNCRYTIHFSSRTKPWGILPNGENYLCVAENFALKELGETLKKQAAAERCADCGADSRPRVHNGASPQAALWSWFRRASSVDVHATSPPHNSSHSSAGPNMRLSGSEPSSLQSLSSRANVFSFDGPPDTEVESPSDSNLDPAVASGGATENASAEGSSSAASSFIGSGANLNDPEDVPETPVDVLDACPSIHPAAHRTSDSAARARDALAEKLQKRREINDRVAGEIACLQRQSLERSLTASQDSSTTVHHPPNAATSSANGLEADARSNDANGHSRLQPVPGPGESQGAGSERCLDDLDSRARGGELVEETSESTVVHRGAVAGGGDNKDKRETPKKKGFKSIVSRLFRHRHKPK